LRHSFSEGLPFFLCYAAELLGRPDVRNMLRTEKVKKNGGRKKVTQLSFVGRIRLSESILPPHMIRLHRQECGQMDSFVPKKKSAAESVTPEVLVNP